MTNEKIKRSVAIGSMCLKLKDIFSAVDLPRIHISLLKQSFLMKIISINIPFCSMKLWELEIAKDMNLNLSHTNA